MTTANTTSISPMNHELPPYVTLSSQENITISDPKRLLVLDVDSTLINEECIDVLAEYAGVGETTSDITSRAMNGELDFHEALAARVGMLQGLHDSVISKTQQHITYTLGAQTMVEEAHRRGWIVGLVSGGFHNIIDDLARAIHIDYVLANRFDIENHVFTGKTVGTIVDKTVKLQTITQWANQHHLTLENCITVGDGANDIPMLQAAGIGIGFCAKPIVQQAIPLQIHERNLMRIFEIVDQYDALHASNVE